MSIKPIKINIREPFNTNEKNYNSSKSVLISSKKNKENNRKKSLNKKIRKFLFTNVLLFQKTLRRTPQQRKSKYKSQLEVFVSSTKYFILIGKYLGLFPILGKKPKKRFSFLSWRYAFSVIIFLAQLVATIFCFIAILETSINIKTFSYISFYGTTCVASLLVMRLATKWYELLKQVEAANLNEYIDPYIQLKCNIATFVFFTFAILDHVLSNIPKFLSVLDCISENDTVYEQYILTAYAWFFAIGLPYALPFGIILPVLNMIVAVNWSYCHIFVICVSLYLSSILKQINKKVISSEGQVRTPHYVKKNPLCPLMIWQPIPLEMIKMVFRVKKGFSSATVSIIVRIYMVIHVIVDLISKQYIKPTESQQLNQLTTYVYFPVSYWRALRQDYSRATKLVRAFDAVINSIVFATFASNLFFVCLQVYYVLRNDITAQHDSSPCPDNSTVGPYYAYLPMFVNTYFVYSSSFVIIRTFIVSIIAAQVHSASLELAPVLYSVPSSTYCIEVQRFIEQIHGDRVALTGLNFFYVTKELVLSMIGTIITYELVLLQLD